MIVRRSKSGGAGAYAEPLTDAEQSTVQAALTRGATRRELVHWRMVAELGATAASGVVHDPAAAIVKTPHRVAVNNFSTADAPQPPRAHN